MLRSIWYTPVLGLRLPGRQEIDDTPTIARSIPNSSVVYLRRRSGRDTGGHVGEAVGQREGRELVQSELYSVARQNLLRRFNSRDSTKHGSGPHTAARRLVVVPKSADHLTSGVEAGDDSIVFVQDFG